MYLILVENKFISSRGIKALLSKNKINCEVINCSTIEGLVDISRKLSPEIVIIDFDIFRGHSEKTLVNLRRDNPDAYILGLINNEQYEKLQHAIKLGIDDYMVKPLQVNELILRVKIAGRGRIKSFGKENKDTPFESRAEIPTISQTKKLNKISLEELKASGEDLHEKTPAGQVFSCSEEKAYETSLELAGIEIETALETICPDEETSFEESSFENPECNEQEDNIDYETEVIETEPVEEPSESVLCEEKPEEPIVFGNCNSSRLSGKAPVNKLVTITKNVLTFSLLIFIFVLSFFLIQARIGGGATSLGGYQMYVVLSGSMSPAFDAGSLVFVKTTDPAGIKEGDIISFSRSDDPARFTIHRVIQVNSDNEISFITRGDASVINDSYLVKPDQLIGTVAVSIPYLGHIFTYAQTRQGVVVLLFIPLFLITLFIIRSSFSFRSDKQLVKNLIIATPKKGLSKILWDDSHPDDSDPGKVKAPGRMCHLLK